MSALKAVTLRAPRRGELSTFFAYMRNGVSSLFPTGDAGSLAAFGGEVDFEWPEACYLMAEEQSGAVVGGSAIFNADGDYVELAPPLLDPRYSGAGLGKMMTLLHCVQQSFFEPSRTRLYWSAVPVLGGPTWNDLNECGFHVESRLWSRLADGLIRRRDGEQTAWLAAEPRGLAKRMLDELDAGTWLTVGDEIGTGISFSVVIDQEFLSAMDARDVAAEVSAFS